MLEEEEDYLSVESEGREGKHVAECLVKRKHERFSYIIFWITITSRQQDVERGKEKKTTWWSFNKISHLCHVSTFPITEQTITGFRYKGYMHVEIILLTVYSAFWNLWHKSFFIMYIMNLLWTIEVVRLHAPNSRKGLLLIGWRSVQTMLA